jgi:hypothetical protein
MKERELPSLRAVENGAGWVLFIPSLHREGVRGGLANARLCEEALAKVAVIFFLNLRAPEG